VSAHQQNDLPLRQLLRVPARPDADGGQRQFNEHGKQHGLDPLHPRVVRTSNQASTTSSVAVAQASH